MYVNLTFKVLWQFKDYPYLKVTKDKKIINCKTSTLLKYNTRGYFVGGKYYKRNQLNKMIEKIKIEQCPFKKKYETRNSKNNKPITFKGLS